MDSTSKLTFRFVDLLGIVVWIQSIDEGEHQAHAAAMVFFGTHNPQPMEFFKTTSKQIQIGIVKINEAKERFVNSALEAAMRQSKKLDPCVLVVQIGTLQMDNPPANQAYIIGTFFRGPEPYLVIPQPGTQIVLE